MHLGGRIQLPGHTQGTVLQHVIGAIGEPDFTVVTARSVLDWLDFDLATVASTAR
jgi:hypothetical protein